MDITSSKKRPGFWSALHATVALPVKCCQQARSKGWTCAVKGTNLRNFFGAYNSGWSIVAMKSILNWVMSDGLRTQHLNQRWVLPLRKPTLTLRRAMTSLLSPQLLETLKTRKSSFSVQKQIRWVQICTNIISMFTRSYGHKSSDFEQCVQYRGRKQRKSP